MKSESYTSSQQEPQQEQEEFLFFVKEYLESNHPPLSAEHKDADTASFSFEDGKYGKVTVLFFKGGHDVFRYYAHCVNAPQSSPLSRLIAATPNNTAIGNFSVHYKENNITKHYYINVGKSSDAM